MSEHEYDVSQDGNGYVHKDDCPSPEHVAESMFNSLRKAYQKRTIFACKLKAENTQLRRQVKEQATGIRRLHVELIEKGNEVVRTMRQVETAERERDEQKRLADANLRAMEVAARDLDSTIKQLHLVVAERDEARANCAEMLEDGWEIKKRLDSGQPIHDRLGLLLTRNGHVLLDKLKAQDEERDRLRDENKQLQQEREMVAADVAFYGRGNPAELCLLVNDVFVPAADAEEVPTELHQAVYDIWKRHGKNGLLAWTAKRRGIEPKDWRGNPIALAAAQSGSEILNLES